MAIGTRWAPAKKCESCGGAFRSLGVLCAVCKEDPGQRRQSVKSAELEGAATCEAGDCIAITRMRPDGTRDTVCSMECEMVVKKLMMRTSDTLKVPPPVVPAVTVRTMDPNRRLAVAAAGADQQFASIRRVTSEPLPAPKCRRTTCDKSAAKKGGRFSGFSKYCSRACMWKFHDEKKLARERLAEAIVASVASPSIDAPPVTDVERSPGAAHLPAAPVPRSSPATVDSSPLLPRRVAEPEQTEGPTSDDPASAVTRLLRHLQDALDLVPGVNEVSVKLTMTRDRRITPAAPVFGGES